VQRASKCFMQSCVCVQSFSVERGICYAYRLEKAIPDQVCNDPRCGQPFHQACLYEVGGHTHTHTLGILVT